MRTSRTPGQVGGRSRLLLLGVELATGASALVCGAVIARSPDGSPLGLPAEVLERGPFSSWRLPGLLLGGFVGLGYLTAAAWEWARLPFHGELSVIAGGGLVVFEVVEWAWLGFHPLQVVFMGVGAAVVALAVPPEAHPRVAQWSGT